MENILIAWSVTLRPRILIYCLSFLLKNDVRSTSQISHSRNKNIIIWFRKEETPPWECSHFLWVLRDTLYSPGKRQLLLQLLFTSTESLSQVILFLTVLWPLWESNILQLVKTSFHQHGVTCYYSRVARKRLHSLKDIKGRTIEEVFFPGQYLGFMDS